MDHRRQRPKTREVGQNYRRSDAVHRMLKPRNTRDFHGALDTRKLCLPGDKQLILAHAQRGHALNNRTRVRTNPGFRRGEDALDLVTTNQAMPSSFRF